MISDVTICITAKHDVAITTTRDVTYVTRTRDVTITTTRELIHLIITD